MAGFHVVFRGVQLPVPGQFIGDLLDQDRLQGIAAPVPKPVKGAANGIGGPFAAREEARYASYRPASPPR